MDGQDRSRWHGVDYLRQGSKAQQRAYHILTKRQILDQLEPYNPVLAGTLPLDLAIAGSDLDILCEMHIHPLFVAHVEPCFGKEGGLSTGKHRHGSSQLTIVNFTVYSLESNFMRSQRF